MQIADTWQGLNPTNTPHVFHVETMWERSFPRRFNREFTWCVRRKICRWHMECDCHIFSKYLVFQMKNLLFKSKYLVFRSKTLNFDQNSRYLESEILKNQVFHNLDLNFERNSQYLENLEFRLNSRYREDYYVPWLFLFVAIVWTVTKRRSAGLIRQQSVQILIMFE